MRHFQLRHLILGCVLQVLLVGPSFAEIHATTSISNISFQAFQADGQISPSGVSFGLHAPDAGTFAQTTSTFPGGGTGITTSSFDPRYLTVGASFSNPLSLASATSASNSFADLGPFSTEAYSLGGSPGFTAFAAISMNPLSSYSISFTFLGNTTRLRVTADATYFASVTGGNGPESVQVSTQFMVGILGLGVTPVGQTVTLSSPYDATTGLYLPNQASFTGQIAYDLIRTSGDLNSGSFGIWSFASGVSNVSPVPELSSTLQLLAGCCAIGVTALRRRCDFRLRRSKLDVLPK
jgi:hypothetical protein